MGEREVLAPGCVDCLTEPLHLELLVLQVYPEVATPSMMVSGALPCPSELGLQGLREGAGSPQVCRQPLVLLLQLEGPKTVLLLLASGVAELPLVAEQLRARVLPRLGKFTGLSSTQPGLLKFPLQHLSLGLELAGLHLQLQLQLCCSQRCGFVPRCVQLGLQPLAHCSRQAEPLHQVIGIPQTALLCAVCLPELCFAPRTRGLQSARFGLPAPGEELRSPRLRERASRLEGGARGLPGPRAVLQLVRTQAVRKPPAVAWPSALSTQPARLRPAPRGPVRVGVLG